MSLPRVVAKVVFTGSKILGRAMAEAGRQAMANARHRPEAAEGSQAGSSSATGGDPAKRLTADLKMTLEEACLILNVKKDDPLEVVEKNYERIFAANAPPDPAKQAAAAAASPPTRASSRAARQKVVGYSHYLQSKVFRALERIKAEQQGSAPAPPVEGEAAAAAAAGAEGQTTGAATTAAGEAAAAKEAASSPSSAEPTPPPPPPPPPKEEKQRTVKEGETISL